ncbi:ENTH/ANTH/VHS superfamily protein isoform 1 [Hibiscus syriacus]|uniref:ENTH/ANTH/VHS superfamily protein isoform 1 n=1 Tax=Hibiscus syriacus TaxID=106335 RepID=A0A6A2ZAT2_HIBSY|nr:ENTH/ANTH/VHS superfamily protein isoform 1 [Hibiscus syriacus]
MSWLLKSLQSDVPRSPTSSPDHSPTNQNGGVKDDLSVIGDSIGRQLRGVAAFLAPPPSVTASERGAEEEETLFPDQDDRGGHDKDEDDDHDDDGVPGITDEVVETRDALLQKLQNNKNAQTENSSLDASEEGGKFGETIQENGSSEERVSEIVNVAEGLEITSGEDSAVQWVEEADISSGSPVRVVHNLENEEDVSFSDLEDDDNYLSNRVSVPKSKQHDKAPSSSGSNDWVQLNKRPETRDLHKAGQSNFQDKYSEGEESNEWLTDDDFVNVARAK